MGCRNCGRGDVPIFRRGVCRSCHRKLGADSPVLAPDMSRKPGVPTTGYTRLQPRDRAGDETGVEAMRLLSEGWAAQAVARRLGVSRWFVYDRRDSPEGQRLLAEARKARAESFRGAAEEARQVLREAAVKAAQALAEGTVAPRSASRIQAAQAVLDRIGLPRTERTELAAVVLDLRVLSDEELRLLEELEAKARGATA